MVLKHKTSDNNRNLMIYILLTTLPMMVSAFWCIILTDDYLRYRSMQRMFIALFAATCTVLYAGHCVFFNHYTDIIPLTDSLYAAAQLTVFPLYYIYLDLSQSAMTLTTRRKAVLLLPACCIGLVTAVLYILMGKSECRLFITEFLYDARISALSGLPLVMAVTHCVARVVFLLQIPLTLYYEIHIIRLHGREVDAIYADTEGRRMNHPRLTFIIFITTCVVSIISAVAGRESFLKGSPLPLALPSLLFSALIWMLCHDAHLMRENLHNTEKTEEAEYQEDNDTTEPATQTAPSSTPTDHIDILSKRIDQLMREEHFYLKPDLKISDIAERLATNRNYIHQAINQRMGVSFAEYINSQRITHAQQLLSTQPDIQITRLMLICGYTNLGSFYRNFKLYTGMSLSAYAKKYEKEKV